MLPDQNHFVKVLLTSFASKYSTFFDIPEKIPDENRRDHFEVVFVLKLDKTLHIG
jgi:hypothetical protein